MPDGEEKSYEQRNAEEAESKKPDPSEKGLKWERGCTDILCCLIFIVFTVAIFGVSFYAFGSGDPSRIMTPFDSDGNACGKPD
jgi:choline transporter-like protein 2/4/5